METSEGRLNYSRETETKEKIYERFCEGRPNAFYILSGGITKVKLDDEVKWRSGSYADLDPHGLASGGKARVLATAELEQYFPQSVIVTNSHYEKEAPTHAEVASQELVHYGVPQERIILHPESNSTFTELTDLVRMVVDKNWQHVAVVTNEFQIPRAEEMLRQILVEEELEQQKEKIKTIYTEALSNFKRENREYILKFKQNKTKITFVAAENVLPHRDKKYLSLIEKARETDAYKKRVETERQAVEQLKAGVYGRKLERQENKN